MVPTNAMSSRISALKPSTAIHFDHAALEQLRRAVACHDLPCKPPDQNQIGQA